MTGHELLAIFGRNIKFYRNIKRWSQEVLAEKVGVSKNTICEIETGKKFVHADSLAKFSNAFSVDPYKLFLPENVVATDPMNLLSKFSTEAQDKLHDLLNKYMDDMKN